MSTEEGFIPSSDGTTSGDIAVEQAAVDRLHKNVLGLPAIVFLCIAAIAPAASMMFNIPVMASQAGASTPLVFVLAALGILLLGRTVVYFSSRLSSASGFYTWVRHGLGTGPGFQVAWLLLGGYALFEAALQMTVGGGLENSLSALGFHLPGGWVSYAVLLTLVVGVLSYFDVKWSVWIMAPFAAAEVAALVLLDTAITLKGGAAGHDVLHTFTPLGATLRGVAPGGTLGLGLAMVLGVLAFTGFETGAVYGEEARHPQKTIPFAMFSLLLGLAVLYIWTAYSATIGVGWSHAVDVLGNVNTAPGQYVTLASTFVGSWLGVGLVIFVLTSNFASAFAMHQTMVRYLYSMGREGLVPQIFGRTHPRWRSPYPAIFAQSGFSLLVILLFGLVVQHTNAQGETVYAVGFADGKVWQQTSGIVSFGWLASVVTMMIIIVYIMTNIASPFFARTRGELHVCTHVIVPAASTLLFLLPLSSYILPALPGPVGSFFTGLGFAPAPFPSNILPLFVLAWIVAGLAYAASLHRRAPERLEMLGRIIREES
jgi:amino acid transporter